MRLASLGFHSVFLLGFYPWRVQVTEVRGYCYSYTSLWRGLSKFDSRNLILGVSPVFLSADMSAGRAWPFPTTVSLAGLVQPWQQLNFSPCPAAHSGPRCQSSGEGGGGEGGGEGMLGLAVLSKQELVVGSCCFV